MAGFLHWIWPFWSPAVWQHWWSKLITASDWVSSWKVRVEVKHHNSTRTSPDPILNPALLQYKSGAGRRKSGLGWGRVQEIRARIGLPKCEERAGLWADRKMHEKCFPQSSPEMRRPEAEACPFDNSGRWNVLCTHLSAVWAFIWPCWKPKCFLRSSHWDLSGSSTLLSILGCWGNRNVTHSLRRKLSQKRVEGFTLKLRISGTSTVYHFYLQTSMSRTLLHNLFLKVGVVNSYKTSVSWCWLWPGLSCLSSSHLQAREDFTADLNLTPSKLGCTALIQTIPTSKM